MAPPSSSATPTTPAPRAGWLTSSPRPGRNRPDGNCSAPWITWPCPKPFDYFDEAALFYRSLLGLRHQANEEVASPYGLIRSRAVRSVAGGVRLVLNVPLL